MKVDTYAVLSRCVEEGVRAGLRRSNKHRDEASQIPDDEAAVEAVHMAVMGAVCEYFKFPDPEGGA